ncbi:MAG: SGNH/GDSL hydrolase family protein [Muribaculaceae bacterium]|nr:SGNH/GDSL hydrolase family protein [Muribaculaceae bacterium]
MINHCKPYRCNIFRSVSVVFLILLGFAHASANAHPSSSKHPQIALLGDSMTWIGGDSCQNPTGWSHVLKESGIAGKIDVYARSGASWTNTKSTKRNPQHYTELLHDDNVVYNQAVRLIEKADNSNELPDIIVLFAGANDAWFVTKRPGLYDKEDSDILYSSDTDPAMVTTLEGSINLVVELLQERFPYAHLLFVTPLQMSKTDAESIFRVSDIIERTASKKGHHVLRADKETDINHEQEAQSPKYTYDGVHTNQEGARLLGDYILKFLISYLQNSTTSQLITDN